MKLFISADIEGTAGIVSWEETEAGKRGHDYFSREMTQEVAAACEGAIEAGFRDILVKDAHDSARNIDPSGLPREARIFRGWAGSPLVMMAGLDETFDAAIMTGYHSGSGSDGNPLSHTMTPRALSVRFNGEPVSEFVINAYTAGYLKVPVAFLSGDRQLCESVGAFTPAVRTLAVSEGVGGGSVSIHPALAQERIRDGVHAALSGDLSQYRVELPEYFEVDVDYREHADALRYSFYPGARRTGTRGVRYESPDYMDVLRFLFFAI
jgi:D-amino peptidase